MGDVVDAFEGGGRPGNGLRIAKPWHWKRAFLFPVACLGLYLLWLACTGGIGFPVEQIVENTLSAAGEDEAPGTILDRATIEETSAALNAVLGFMVGIFGFFIALPSILFGLHHEGWDFSPDRSAVAHWWGLGVRMFNRSVGPNLFVEVAVSKEVRRSNRGRRADFIVSLAGSTKPAEVAKFATYREARQAGERLAKRLQWPMRDDAGPNRIRRQPDELDQSVRDQARSLGGRPPRPTPPEPLTMTFTEADGTLDLRIPPSGLRGSQLRVFGAALLGAFFGYLLLVRPFAEGFAPGPDDSAQFAAAVNWLIFIGTWSPVVYALAGVALPLWWRSRVHHRLEVSRDLLRVHRFSPAGFNGVELDAADIEQITVAPREGDAQRSSMTRVDVVSVRSDAGFAEFGAGLTDLEREWLRDLLLHYLAG